MSSNERPCPIWESPLSVKDISEVGICCHSPRAGGDFTLKRCGAPLLQSHLLTDRQRANLSYWIYKQNLENRRFDDSATGPPPVVDQAWVEGHRDRTPSAEDRMLMFLREVIRSDDAGEQRERDRQLEMKLRMAAGGCRGRTELSEFYRYANKQGWMGAKVRSLPGQEFTDESIINLPARIHVEEQLRDLGTGRQGFVAMWFADCMNEVYEDGIKPGICDAGYEPMLIKDKDYLGGVFDEIVAEIRQSRFVVADFTACKECTACEKCKNIGARGNVYYEAGFAFGMGIPVIYTCHSESEEALYFDTSHLNHILWKDAEDLKCRLRNRIEAVLGHGPLTSSSDDQKVVGSNSSLAAEQSPRQ